MKTQIPAKNLSKSQRITRDDWTRSPWPFTAKAVTLKATLIALVVNQRIFEITVSTTKKVYGLNGIAQERHPSIRQVWLNDPAHPGQKIDVTAMIEYAQAMFWDPAIKPD
jgi:hypothetical protein